MGEREKGRIEKETFCEIGETYLYLLTSLLKHTTINILRSHKKLDVYQIAFKSSMEIFYLSKTFPKDEIFSLTSQIRRSSMSVSANIAEAFRKSRYEKAFVAKLSDSEAEAAETQVWLDYSLECGYITKEIHSRIIEEYERIIGKIVMMIYHSEKWVPS